MYVHVAPPWVVLSGAGALLLVSGWGLHRFLDSGAGAERAGYTAASFGGKSDRHQAAEILASVARFTPGASATENKPGFEGGGGEFGGGGASGKF
jgi:uncharacterized membrane protein YgcG